VADQESSKKERRSGRVALVGRPNVGKSTLLNAALESPLAAVSPTPQTTRESLLGVVHHGDAELLILDTPGLHRPKSELGRVMNNAAREAARSADVIVVVVEFPEPKGGPGKKRTLAPHPGDLTLIADLAGAASEGHAPPAILVVNKVDRGHDKSRMLPLLEHYAHVHPFVCLIPISARKADGVKKVLDEVAKLLPVRDWEHDDDALTDRPTRFFAAEYVREQILRTTQKEVPHAAAVQIDRYVDPPAGAVHIDATIFVERLGQKRIVIGAGGEMLKKIGTQARLRLEELVGRKVNLKLWVKVEPEWRESRRMLEELGYSLPGRTPAPEIS
jgi:GTP-binding protein Era